MERVRVDKMLIDEFNEWASRMELEFTCFKVRQLILDIEQVYITVIYTI